MTIKLVTDIRGNEPDLLIGNHGLPLEIRSLGSKTVLARFQAPENGWTHERLMAVAERIDDDDLADGADCYLGEAWIGGTEV